MSTRWMVPLVLAALAYGCTSLEIFPREGDLIIGADNPVPVTIRAVWPNGGVGMGPVVEVDGVRVPAAAVTSTASGLSATVLLRPGPHTVRVRTAQLCLICVGNVGEFDLTRRFFVTTSAATVSLR